MFKSGRLLNLDWHLIELGFRLLFIVLSLAAIVWMVKTF